MKKSLLLFALAGIIGISSCGKNGCKTCTQLTMKYEICEDGVEYYAAGVKISSAPLNSGQSVNDYAEHLESSGFKCK